MKKFTNAFSLIEVLIFVTIFSLFFVAASAVVTVSLKNISISEHKLLATRYAQEFGEWLRGEKEADFDTLLGRVPSPGPTYCFNKVLATAPPTWDSSVTSNAACAATDFSGDVDGPGIYPPIFKRQVTLTAHGSSEIQADIVVSWIEAGRTNTVPITLIMSIAQ